MASHSTPLLTNFEFDFLRAEERLNYEGDAISYLRLTKTDPSGNPEKNRYGRITHRNPVILWKSPTEIANFETTVKFIPSSNNNKEKPADGLAFFMVPKKHIFPSDPIDGNLGIYPGDQCPKLFAVEFDIFPNPGWDPEYPHIGINIGTRKSQVSERIPEPFIGKEVTLKINYTARTKLISATATVDNGRDPVQIEHEFDLCGFFKEGGEVQVGLAASTGGTVAKHDVTFWGFSSNIP